MIFDIVKQMLFSEFEHDYHYDIYNITNEIYHTVQDEVLFSDEWYEEFYDELIKKHLFKYIKNQKTSSFFTQFLSFFYIKI